MCYNIYRKEEYKMELDFNELFGDALGCLIEACGGSMEAALDTMRIRNNDQRAEIKDWYDWEETFKVKCTKIKYCVEDEDVADKVSDPDDEDEVAEKIAEIKADLPTELEVEVECTEKGLEDAVAEAISDETGWLTEDFEMEVID